MNLSALFLYSVSSKIYNLQYILMKVQEQFLHLENYRSEWDRPSQLEIFPEEAKAQIVDIFNANPENIKKEVAEIEPLDSDEI